MIKTISGAFERPFDKTGSHGLPTSFKQAFDRARGALSTQELRVLVTAMVD